MYFRRKIDDFLIQWKQDPSHKPLIVKGARQIGKTESILHFANEQYSSVVYINFVLDKKFRMIVSDGYDVDTVIKNISLANPAIRFVAGETIIIFDEIQEYPFLSDSISSSLYLLGASLRVAYIIPMLVAVMQVFCGFYCFIKFWFKKGSVAFIAFILFFYDGGFGFIHFLNKVNFSKNFTEFYFTPTSIGDYNYRWAQIIANMLIPQRATLFGWAVLFPLLAFLYYAKENRSIKSFLIAGIMAAGLPMIHTHSFLALGIICAVWLFWDMYKEKESYLLSMP